MAWVLDAGALCLLSLCSEQLTAQQGLQGSWHRRGCCFLLQGRVKATE